MYRPKGVEDVSDALDAFMEEWADNDEEELRDALENLGEAIQELPVTGHTNHLI